MCPESVATELVGKVVSTEDKESSREGGVELHEEQQDDYTADDQQNSWKLLWSVE